MTTRNLRALSGVAALALLGAACTDRSATAPESARSALALDVPASAARGTLARLRQMLRHPRQPARRDPALLAGAGDIARCYPGGDATQLTPPGPDNPAEQTARLLDGLPDATVMAVGDNAYEFGSPVDYSACYHPTWGRHRDRTRPATGNHEYLTPGAAGYFAYFGLRAAPPTGYYSYDLNGWHIVVLNSTPQVYACWPPELDEIPPGFPAIPPPATPGPAAGEACVGDLVQQRWLGADLRAHADAPCTLAYFHHPRYSSGPHGNTYQMQRMWDTLYAYGADVVVSGHDHLYERFAPQDPYGSADPRWGIRQFTVGTGGAEFYHVGERQPNSEVLINSVHGIITLALDRGRYAWAFLGVDGAVHDAGGDACHGAPVRATTEY